MYFFCELTAMSFAHFPVRLFLISLGLEEIVFLINDWLDSGLIFPSKTVKVLVEIQIILKA